jgi:hypothetical protein
VFVLSVFSFVCSFGFVFAQIGSIYLSEFVRIFVVSSVSLRFRFLTLRRLGSTEEHL